MGFEEWNLITLDKILEINPRIPLKKGAIAKKVAMADIKEFTRKVQDYELTEFKSGSKFQNDDTLMARITPCLENGKTAYMDILDESEVAFGSTEFFILRAKENLADSKFVYYLSTSEEIRNIAIQSMTGTSGRQRAQKESILNHEMNIPPLGMQKKIGEFLSKLDDKIEINLKNISTLEQLAQTLFKRWFVDFEFPNENGEPYKSSGGEMVESELRMRPKEWEVGTLNDFGKIVGGGTPRRKNEAFFTENGISWITPKDLSNDKSVYMYKGATDITEEGLDKSSATLHPENTVLFSSRAPIGYVAIAGKSMATNQGFKSIVPYEYIPSEYVYTMLKYLTPKIESNAGGSTFKEISGAGMKKIKTLVPSFDVLDKYRILITPNFNNIKSLEKENRTLIDLRDTLLPKLLSGEIELPDEMEDLYEK